MAGWGRGSPASQSFEKARKAGKARKAQSFIGFFVSWTKKSKKSTVFYVFSCIMNTKKQEKHSLLYVLLLRVVGWGRSIPASHSSEKAGKAGKAQSFIWFFASGTNKSKKSTVFYVFSCIINTKKTRKAQSFICFVVSWFQNPPKGNALHAVYGSTSLYWKRPQILPPGRGREGGQELFYISIVIKNVIRNEHWGRRGGQEWFLTNA